ncbi:MAG: ABC transporter ATP-binding protein [Alphaproteobacteria bacterium]|nr:MAG: ABC transporter ATP-binding protein [Alphaproteobacteria bacterium]
MQPAVLVEDLEKRFPGSAAPALADLAARIPAGRITGLVGPDGAGKTTLMRLIAGLLHPSRGRIRVLGHDTVAEPDAVHALIGYMPQRFGLYEELSVLENLRLYAELRGLARGARKATFERLLAFTGLASFTSRRAGALSGGMKQKLGLACALLETPNVLLLDEPSVGVDPLSRRELWSMVEELRSAGTTILWSTAYLDEAERCDEVLLLNEGRLLFAGPPGALKDMMRGRTIMVRDPRANRRALLRRALEVPGVIDGVVQGRAIRLVLGKGVPPPEPHLLGASAAAEIRPDTPRFEDAFIDRLGGGPGGHSPLAAAMPAITHGSETVVTVEGLTKRFGTFTAADGVSFSIRRGEIFGLLGPNGAGKSTLFRMMCGLLTPTAGRARVAGLDLATAGGRARARIGYMAQKFSLYGSLSVRQNLEFFSGAYNLRGRHRRRTIRAMIDIFHLAPHLDMEAGLLPLGFKQRLALACAVMHQPDVLFLDEPTSGVDPLTRREFWTHINGLVEKGVTVVVTTHFMDEAEYCDRLALIYRGRLIAEGTPDALKLAARSEDRPDPTLEDAFIALIRAEDANGERAVA